MSIEFVKGFGEYTRFDRVNEMASELTKLNVPKNIMQFIHKLDGKLHNLIPAGHSGSRFHTQKEPFKAAGGPWPARQDLPLAHDVSVVGTKRGKKNIYHYLTEIVDSRKDIPLKLIVVNPSDGNMHYITRQTGKMSKAQMRDANIMNTDHARELGISNKRGLYLRYITMDIDSGSVVSQWGGTISQVAEDWDEDTIMYIMEDESRVMDTRSKRKEYKEVTEDQFIKYFTDNFTSIVDKMLGKSTDALKQEWKDTVSSIEPDDVGDSYSRVTIEKEGESGIGAKLAKLKSEIASKKFDPESLKPKLNNFLELAFKEGEYNRGEGRLGNGRADLTDMSEKHTMPILASMFLQYIVLGKVHKKFYTDDIFKELGLDDLLD